MADYKKMYKLLFNGMTDVIDILQSAQQQTEEMYLEANEPDIRFAEPRLRTEVHDDE
jgi:hypothetical protein